MTNLADGVLNDHEAVRRHVEGDLACQTRGFCEHIEVPAGKDHGDRLVHLNDDRLFLSSIAPLDDLDGATSVVAGGRELNALLVAAEHQRLAKLREVADNPLKFTRGILITAEKLIPGVPRCS